jgi:hypothetical protein
LFRYRFTTSICGRGRYAPYSVWHEEKNPRDKEKDKKERKYMVDFSNRMDK